MKHIALTAFASLVLITGCSTGGHKVTGTLHEPFPPDAVMVYSQMPAHAQVVGVIYADSFGGTTLQDASHDAVQKLKSEAGRLGANGVLLVGVSDQPLEGAKIQAKAIYVNP